MILSTTVTVIPVTSRREVMILNSSGFHLLLKKPLLWYPWMDPLDVLSQPVNNKQSATGSKSKNPMVYHHIANLRYPAKNDTFFAGERRYSQKHTKRLT